MESFIDRVLEDGLSEFVEKRVNHLTERDNFSQMDERDLKNLENRFYAMDLDIRTREELKIISPACAV